MLFKYAEKNTPFVLSPDSLDWYLGKGWYRMGANIFTTHFLYFQDRPFSAIWIRLDLQDFRFSKRQRKLMRRNAEIFTLACGKRVIDQERNTLYRTYAANFDGRLSPSISDSLEDYDGESIFNTYETTVREKSSGKLVAASYFDVGESAAASILGFYEPALATFSLGYYTMLLEIEHCLAQGFRYYYPGYVVPGYPRFDYKLRLGDSEFFDVHSDTWRPYDHAYIERYGPAEIQVTKLQQLIQATRAVYPAANISIYPFFEAGLYDLWNDDYVPYPYFFSLGEDSAGNLIIIAYDPKDRQYLVLQCDLMEQTQLLFNTRALKQREGQKYFTDLLVVRTELFRTDNFTIISRTAAAILAQSS